MVRPEQVYPDYRTHYTTIDNSVWDMAGVEILREGEVMDKEPTEAQVKEFLELCGLIIKGYWWYNAEGIHLTSKYNNPHIDLNFLFQYAMPKVKGLVSEQHFVQMMHDWLSDVLDGDDPALALFWAIYPTLKEAKK